MLNAQMEVSEYEENGLREKVKKTQLDSSGLTRRLTGYFETESQMSS